MTLKVWVRHPCLFAISSKTFLFYFYKTNPLLRIDRFTSVTLRNTKFGSTFVFPLMWLTLAKCTSQLNVEENNYNTAEHSTRFSFMQHAITHTLCYGSSMLFCNYSNTGCGQEHKRSIILFFSTCITHVRKAFLQHFYL